MNWNHSIETMEKNTEDSQTVVYKTTFYTGVRPTVVGARRKLTSDTSELEELNGMLRTGMQLAGNDTSGVVTGNTSTRRSSAVTSGVATSNNSTRRSSASSTTSANGVSVVRKSAPPPPPPRDRSHLKKLDGSGE